MGWNVFRVLADLSHLASICLLIWAIHKNKSAEGKLSFRYGSAEIGPNMANGDTD